MYIFVCRIIVYFSYYCYHSNINWQSLWNHWILARQNVYFTPDSPYETTEFLPLQNVYISHLAPKRILHKDVSWTFIRKQVFQWESCTHGRFFKIFRYSIYNVLLKTLMWRSWCLVLCERLCHVPPPPPISFLMVQSLSWKSREEKTHWMMVFTVKWFPILYHSQNNDNQPFSLSISATNMAVFLV